MARGSLRALPSPDRADTATRALAVHDGYLAWRLRCLAVEDAYHRWLTAQGRRRADSHAGYVAALEREATAAEAYAALLQPVTAD